MKNINFFFLICVSNIGTTFQAEVEQRVLQYCFYKGQWSLIFKYEKNLKIIRNGAELLKK